MERRLDFSHSFTEFRLYCAVVWFEGVGSWCKSSMSSAKRKSLVDGGNLIFPRSLKNMRKRA